MKKFSSLRVANLSRDPRILLAASSNTHSREILRLAKKIAAEGLWKISFLALGDAYWTGAESLKRFARETQNAELLDFRLPEPTGQPPTWSSSTLSRLVIFLVTSWKDFRRAKVLFKGRKFQLLVVCEDGLGGPLRIISEALKSGTMVTILPYEYSTKEARFRALADSPVISEVTTLRHKLIARFFPKWVATFFGRNYIRLPIKDIFYHELFGLSVPDPWTVHGGRASVLLAESEQMLSHYLSEGVPAEKIRETGSISQDEIFEALQNSARNHSADSIVMQSDKRTRVVVSFPPSYFPSRKGKSEFSNYRELVENWVKLLESIPSVDVRYQAHPNTSIEDINLIKQFVALDNRKISELIAEGDLLITSYSSVIRIAITCQKPVINYDAYSFEYPDYLGVSGVFHASNYLQLSELVSRLLEPDFYKKAVLSLSAISQDWGKVDGLAWSRIRAAIGESLGNKGQGV